MTTLYTISEIPKDEQGQVDTTLGWYRAFWALCPADAFREAYSLYRGDSQLSLIAEHARTSVLWPAVPPQPRHALFEHRVEMLRLAGWSQGDECACACCGLAPMGLAEYAICPECEHCPECRGTAWVEDRCSCWPVEVA